MTVDIDIPKFNPDVITPDKIVAFIGPRGSGKTTCTRDIIWHKRSIPNAVVYCPTENDNGDWERIFPSTYIYSEYNPESAQRVVARQRRQVRRKKRDPTFSVEPVMVVCDDCMYEKKKFTTDVAARSIMMNGRNWYILMLITAQYLMDITRDMRTQFDYVFLFKDNDLGNIERMWKNWAGMIPSFDAFYAIFKHCTQGHGCLVVNTRSLSDDIRDSIFWYKARKDIPDFKVGSRAYWLYHFANVRAQGDEEEEELSFGEKKSKKTQYRVRKLK